MASFFRWRIADKVIPFLSRSISDPKYTHPGVISSFIRIFKSNGESAQLFLPWGRIKGLNLNSDLIDPKELVKYLRNQGLPTAEGFTDIQFCDDPLSIVFTVDKHVYSKFVLSEILSNEEITAKSSSLFQDILPKKVIVHCSIPPVGQLFHLGHFRSAIHSNFIANINKAAGHDVKKVMHVADWGIISALTLTGFKKFGISEDLLSNPAHHLYEVLIASRQLYKNDKSFRSEVFSCFKKMKQGDSDYLQEWNHLTSLHLKQYMSIFKKIGLTFDDTLFESSYSSDISDIEENLLCQRYLTISDDGSSFNINVPLENEKIPNSFSNDDINPPPLNFSRAICTAIQLKKNHDFDKMLYVSSSTEKPFFSIAFSLMKALGHQWAENLHHVPVKYISEVKQKGKNRTLFDNVLSYVETDILRKIHVELKLAVDESIEKMAEALSISSLLIYDMKHKRRDDYEMDMKKVISFQRNTGAALQLCHAGLKGLKEDSIYVYNVEIDTSPLLQKEAHVLVRHLSKFDEAVYASFTRTEAFIIVHYLFSLCVYVDRVSDSLKLDIREDRLIVLKARLMLLEASQKVLQKGLHLLGITPFETNYTPPTLI